MRLREGVPLKRLEREGGRSWRELLPQDKLKPLLGEGFIECDEQQIIKPTIAGMQRLNGILAYLL